MSDPSSANIPNIRPWASAGVRETIPVEEIDVGWVPGEEPAAEYENDRQFVRDTILNAVAEYLNAGIRLQDLRPGGVALDGGGGVKLVLQAGTEISRVRLEETETGLISEMFHDKIFAMLLTGSAHRGTSITADGIKFSGQLGFFHESGALRTVAIPTSGFTWDSSTYPGYHVSSDQVVVSDLPPARLRLASATVGYVEGDTRITAPASVRSIVSGSQTKIIAWNILKNARPTPPIDATFYVTFEILPE